MNEIESRLREKAAELFAGGGINLLIGYEKSSVPLRSRPFFCRDSKSIDKLVWNSFCWNNLAVYLPDLYSMNTKDDEAPPLKTAIVGKGCDIRSIIGLVKEKQIPRKDIVIIGVPCRGVIDMRKIEAKLGNDCVIISTEETEAGLSIKKMSGETEVFDRAQILADDCIECHYPVSREADILIEGEPIESGKEPFARVKSFEALLIEERWKRFSEEISACIRCYACRQACPNCYCKICFIDQTKPRWVDMGNNQSDIMFYHIVRMFHQAGRCVECGACVRACPAGIDLREFAQKLSKDVKELFGYTPGLELDTMPPLCTFEQDDRQEFITEP